MVKILTPNPRRERDKRWFLLNKGRTNFLGLELRRVFEVNLKNE